MDQYIKHLIAVSHKLTQANLALNMKKLHFFKHHLKFLGHIVSEKGVEVDGDKLRAVTDFLPPHNLMALQCFLGLAEWYPSSSPILLLP